MGRGEGRDGEGQGELLQVSVLSVVHWEEDWSILAILGGGGRDQSDGGRERDRERSK